MLRGNVNVTGPRPLEGERITELSGRIRETAKALNEAFLDKQEVIRLMLVSAVAGEHMILVGPPGTAKSALIRAFAELLDARYFEYLLTRFTEPNEIFGPVDIKEFREGRYARRTENMLPEAEVVFLDEIFKSNSAILNSLLTVLNERRFASGPQMVRVPLISVFGASNEVPNDDNLAAMFDRFLVRVVSENLDSFHFHRLVEKGIQHEVRRMQQQTREAKLTAADLFSVHAGFDKLLSFSEDFLAKYKGLVFQIRSEGISLSDRRAVKMLKLFAASAFVDGRRTTTDADFFVMKHIWNNLDQVELLEEIVNPVVDAYYRDRPEERRFLAPQVGIDELLSELKMIRELLVTGGELSDIQLFSQLKNLNDIKAALQAMGNDTSQRMLAEVDQLLETVFASSKFGGVG